MSTLPPPSAREVVADHLARAARARRVRLVLLRAETVVVALALALAAGLGAMQVAPVARPIAVGLLAAVSALGMAWLLFEAVRPATILATARFVARGAPALGGAVQDALELSAELETGRLATGSAGLARAHVAQVALALSRVDPASHARALRRPRPRRALLALGGALAMAVALPGARERLLRGGGGTVPAADVAHVRDVRIAYTYPAYLDLEPRTENGPDVQAPVGTHVEVVATADRPLKWARLVLGEDAPLEMAVDGSLARSSLVVLRDGTYRIELRGATGGVDAAPPIHVIRAIPDEPPRVRLRAPVGDAELEPGEDLTVYYGFSDDHGVDEVVLVLEPAGDTPGDPAEPTPGVTPPPGRRELLHAFDPAVLARTSGARTITPAALGLLEGSAAWLHVEARDNDEVTGPKWAASRRVRVTLRPRSEVEAEAEEAQANLAEQLIAVLASHLVGDPARMDTAEGLLQAARRFQEGVGTVLAMFPAVMEGLRQSPEPDTAAISALDAMRARLDRRLVEHRGRLAAAESAGLTALREALSPQHSVEVEELERDVLFFDMWSDRRAAMRALDDASALARAVERLEGLLREADEANGDEVARARDELQRIDQLVAELQAADRQLAAAASPHAAEDAASGADGARHEALLRELDAALERGDVARARRLAEELRAEVGEMTSRMEDLVDEGGMGDPDLGREIMALREEIGRLRGRQRDLRDRTNAVREEADENVSAEDRQRLLDLKRRLLALADEAVEHEARGEAGVGGTSSMKRFFERLEEVSRIERRLHELDPSGLSALTLPPAQAAERRALVERQSELYLEGLLEARDVDTLMQGAQASREQLGRLRQTLADGALPESRLPAERALQGLSFLARELAGSSDGELAEQTGPFRAAAARTAEILDALEEAERTARRAMDAALGGAQRAALLGMAAEQQDLRQELQAMLLRLRELGADAPFLDHAVGDRLDEAARQMGGAQSHLAEREPSPASEKQGEALALLDEAQRALSPSSPPSPGRGQRGRDGRYGAARERVDIPGAEAFRVPREFREEILEAMRESLAPAGYEESVREYYRRLVE